MILYRRHLPAVLLATVLVVACLAPVLAALYDLIRHPADAVAAIADRVLWWRLLQTLAIVGAALAFICPLGLLLAWTMTRTDMPFGRLLFALSPFPLFLPQLVHVLTWFGVTGVNGFFAIVLVYVISFTPLTILFCARAFGDVSRARHELVRLSAGKWAAVRDEWSQAIVPMTGGGALAAVLILADFAVADFLTSVGPKVTVYADSVYRHHVALRPGGAAGASLVGFALALALMVVAVWAIRSLKPPREGTRELAPSIPLGPWRWPVAVLVAAFVAAGTLAPLASLLWQTQTMEVFLSQARASSASIRFTIRTSALAATVMVALALGISLTVESRGLRRAVIALAILPLALPPLLFGIGLIRVWNNPVVDFIYLGKGVVILAAVARALPFAWMPIGNALARLDTRLTDAAALCGASPFQRFAFIVLPLILPALALAWCVGYCFALRELDTMVMLRAGQQALSFRLYSEVIFARADEVAALALILALVTALPLVPALMLGLGKAKLR